MIIKYKKYQDQVITRELMIPSISMTTLGHEMGTVDGWTYVYLWEGVELGEQPEEIKDSIATVELDEETKTKIKANSPYIKMINERTRAAIKQRYTVQDELELLRTAPSPSFDEYNAFVEELRAKGRNEKDAFGLNVSDEQRAEEAQKIQEAKDQEAAQDLENAVAQHTNAVKRLALPVAAIGKLAWVETVPTGTYEYDEETGEQTEVIQTIEHPAIEPLPLTVETVAIDEEGNSVISVIENPLITKDNEERASAQSIVDTASASVLALYEERN